MGLNPLILLDSDILPCISKKIPTNLLLKYIFNMRDKLSPEVYTCILIQLHRLINVAEGKDVYITFKRRFLQ